MSNVKKPKIQNVRVTNDGEGRFSVMVRNQGKLPQGNSEDDSEVASEAPSEVALEVPSEVASKVASGTSNSKSSTAALGSSNTSGPVSATYKPPTTPGPGPSTPPKKQLTRNNQMRKRVGEELGKFDEEIRTLQSKAMAQKKQEEQGLPLEPLEKIEILSPKNIDAARKARQAKVEKEFKEELNRQANQRSLNSLQPLNKGSKTLSNQAAIRKGVIAKIAAEEAQKAVLQSKKADAAEGKATQAVKDAFTTLSGARYAYTLNKKGEEATKLVAAIADAEAKYKLAQQAAESARAEAERAKAAVTTTATEARRTAAEASSATVVKSKGGGRRKRTHRIHKSRRTHKRVHKSNRTHRAHKRVQRTRRR